MSASIGGPPRTAGFASGIGGAQGVTAYGLA